MSEPLRDEIIPEGIDQTGIRATRMRYRCFLQRTVARFLSNEEKFKSLVTLDIEPDVEDERTFRFDISAVFRPRKLKSGHDVFFIASRGGSVHVVAKVGKILRSHTESVALDVTYNIGAKRSRSAEVKVAPKGELKTGTVEGTVEVGAITLHAGAEWESASSFQGQERTLIAVYDPTLLQWDILSTRGKKAVQDFVSGTMYLFFAMEGAEGDCPVAGTVRFVPDRVEFFDRERRPFGSLKSFFMHRVLQRGGYDVRNVDGVSAQFEVRHEC